MNNEYSDLLQEAVGVLTGNILEGRNYPWFPFKGICPSLDTEFRGIWNWDSAFHAVGVSRFNSALAREQILMWLTLQLPSGELPDVLMEDGELENTYGKPPVMPWAAMVVHKREPNAEFATECYRAFVKLEEHWRLSRSTGEGLFFYDSRAKDPVRREIEIRWESGWDNSVRWDAGIHNLYPVDLACFMVMLYEAMEYFSIEIGQLDETDIWVKRKLQVSSAINSQLWSEGAGTWLDRDRFSGKLSDVLSPACLMPLFAGIASQAQAESSAKLLSNTDIFFPGMPTVAYNHPEFDSRSYWRGRTWLNVAWFALKGLRNYGFTLETNEVRSTLLGWCMRHGIRENYDSVTGEGLGASRFGWSAAFIIEFILGWYEGSSIEQN